MGKRFKGRGRGSITTLKMLTASAPVWIDLGQLEWTTGDVISLSLPDYLNDTSPEGFTTYSENGSTPNDLSEISLSLSSAGLITGTIGAIQGGTFNFLFDASNLEGTTVSSLTVTVVGLEVTAPTFSAVPDALNIEVGEYFLIYLPNYLTDDGDPSSVQTITYAESGDNLPPSFTLTSTGLLSGTCTGISSLQEVTVVATNESGFPTDIKFDMSAVNNSVAAPTMTTMWSGEPSCGLVVPAWGAMPSPAWTVGDVVSIDLNDYIDSIGGAAISAFAISTGALPTSLTLDTNGAGAGLGTITGTIVSGDVTGSPYSTTFTATNSVGASDASGTMTSTATAVAQPQIISISATDGSDEVTVNFDEAMTNASNYNDGFAYKVNGVSKTFIYLSGGTTAQIIYTSEAVLSGNNSLELVYTDTSGTLKGVTSGDELDDYTNVGDLYVVPVAISGEIFSDNFASGDWGYVDPVTNAKWGDITQSTVGHYPEVNNWKPRTGTHSLMFTFGPDVSGTDSSSEIRFSLGSTLYSEVYTEFYMYIPNGSESWGGAAYLHRDEGISTRNKFFRVYDNADENNLEKIGFSTNAQNSDNGSKSVLRWNSLAIGAIEETDRLDDLIKGTDRGSWIRINLRTKMESSIGASDGALQIWKNGTLVHSRTNVDNAKSGQSHKVDYGFLMGWSNSGFSDKTYIFIDDVIFSTEDLLA